MKTQRVKKLAAALLAGLLVMSILLLQGCEVRKKEYDPFEGYTPATAAPYRPTDPAPASAAPAPAPTTPYNPPTITPIQGVPIVPGGPSITPSDSEAPSDTAAPPATDAPPETAAPSETPPPETQPRETETLPEPVPVTDHTTEPYHLDLIYEEVTFFNPGEYCDLLAASSYLPPEYPTYWYSSNEAVATVENGVVTAVGPGTAVITGDCEGYCDSCTVYCDFENVQSELQPYYDVLTEYLDCTNARFLLFNLDGDGVPDLLLAPDSFHFAACMVYTIRNGEAVHVADSGTFGELRYSPWNAMLLDYEWYMSQFYLFTSVSGASATVVARFRNGPETMDSEENTFDIDGTYVTEEEYNQRLNDMLSIGYYTVGHAEGFALTESNISALMQNPEAFYAYGIPFTREYMD